MAIPRWILKQRLRLPHDVKITFAQKRIREWYEHWHGEVYVSFSGGKDSTVLLHLVRSLYPEVPAVFVNTGLEYPEIVRFARSFKHVTELRPVMKFKQVLEQYGYPVVSKECAGFIEEIRVAQAHNKPDWIRQRMYGIRKDGGHTFYCLKPKWHFLVEAPFKISPKCCDVMKKAPFATYVKKTSRHPILGTMASDSMLRRSSYLLYGCNAFDLKAPRSAPLSIWTTHDALQYARDNGLPVCSVYGDVVERRGRLQTTGVERTGCMFCAFGAHAEKEPNRFQKMERTHPKHHAYCMEKLGMREVLEYIHVPWRNRRMAPGFAEKLGLGKEDRLG